MAIASRKGEQGGHYFRSERVFAANGAWYVATREGIDVGPFRTRATAEVAAMRLVQVLRDVADPELTKRLIEASMPVAPDGVWAARWMR